jgi:hypothetical protein
MRRKVKDAKDLCAGQRAFQSEGISIRAKANDQDCKGYTRIKEQRGV